jgi:hypothetical protein
MHTQDVHTSDCLRRLALASFGALAGLLVACGGETAHTAATDVKATRVVGTLLADDGSVMPADPAAIPADPGARTRAQHYATPQQAQQLEQAHPDVLSVEVSCCGHEGAELAVQTVYGLQAAHDKDKQVPVLVRGADARLVAYVANRLTEEGMTHVFAVAR